MTHATLTVEGRFDKLWFESNDAAQTFAPSATVHLDVFWFDSAGNQWRISYNGSWQAKTAL